MCRERAHVMSYSTRLGKLKAHGDFIVSGVVPENDVRSVHLPPGIRYVRIPDEDDQPITTPQMHGTQWNFWIKNGGRHYRLRRFHPRFRLKLGDFAAFADFPPAEMREEYRKLEAIFKMWENQPIAPP